MNKQHKTSIGGQAVIEGIMMRGPERTSLAVRIPDGSIDVETWENPKITAWYKKALFIRGIFNFVDTMRLGYKCLMKSADKSGSEAGEPDKVDLWLNHGGECAPAKSVSPPLRHQLFADCRNRQRIGDFFCHLEQSVAQSSAEDSFIACNCGNFLRNH